MMSKRAQSFPLRLCPSVREQASHLAQSDGISLNHFISLAVAEKITRLEHDLWVRTQPARDAKSLRSALFRREQMMPVHSGFANESRPLKSGDLRRLPVQNPDAM